MTCGRNTSASLFQTNLTSAGVVISSSTGILQSTSAGSSGQVLTSNGAGVAPTYQAVPKGAVIFLGTRAASNSATIEFKSLLSATYNNYLLTIDFCQNQTTGQNLQMLLSTDNGSTYIASGYVSGTNQMAYNSGVITNATDSNSIRLTNAIATGNQDVCGQLFLMNMTRGSGFQTVQGTTSGNTGAILGNTYVYGYYGTPAVINAFKVQFTSGNITTGTFNLYGIAQA